MRCSAGVPWGNPHDDDFHTVCVRIHRTRTCFEQATPPTRCDATSRSATPGGSSAETNRRGLHLYKEPFVSVLLWRARRETERTEPHSLGVVTGIIYIYIYRNSSVHNGSKSVSCDKGTLVRSSHTAACIIYDSCYAIGHWIRCKNCTPTRRPESPDAGHNSIHGHGGAGHGYHVLLKRVSAFTRHATRSCRMSCQELSLPHRPQPDTDTSQR